MSDICRKILLGTVLAASAATLGPTVARADDYWNNHWGWYDNSYRPYYRRHYYRNPNYGGYRYYGPSPYYGNGYNYNAPRTYYYPSGGGVQLGPLRFGWW